VLTLRETAEVIRRGYEATRELVESGPIAARHENGRWYVPVLSVEDYVQRMSAPTRSR
jgi:hypothetical protein